MDLGQKASTLLGDRVRVLSANVTPSDVGRVVVTGTPPPLRSPDHVVCFGEGRLVASEAQALFANISGKTWLDVEAARSSAAFDSISFAFFMLRSSANAEMPYVVFGSLRGRPDILKVDVDQASSCALPSLR